MSSLWVFEIMNLCCCLLLSPCLLLSSCLWLSSCDTAEIWIGRRSVKCGNETFFGSAGNLHQIHLIHYYKKQKYNWYAIPEIFTFETLLWKYIWYTVTEIHVVGRGEGSLFASANSRSGSSKKSSPWRPSQTFTLPTKKILTTDTNQTSRHFLHVKVYDTAFKQIWAV